MMTPFPSTKNIKHPDLFIFFKYKGNQATSIVKTVFHSEKTARKFFGTYRNKVSRKTSLPIKFHTR